MVVVNLRLVVMVVVAAVALDLLLVIPIRLVARDHQVKDMMVVWVMDMILRTLVPVVAVGVRAVLVKLVQLVVLAVDLVEKVKHSLLHYLGILEQVVVSLVEVEEDDKVMLIL